MSVLLFCPRTAGFLSNLFTARGLLLILHDNGTLVVQNLNLYHYFRIFSKGRCGMFISEAAALSIVQEMKGDHRPRHQHYGRARHHLCQHRPGPCGPAPRGSLPDPVPKAAPPDGPGGPPPRGDPSGRQPPHPAGRGDGRGDRHHRRPGGGGRPGRHPQSA